MAQRQQQVGQRARRWCFTLNNYTPQELELLQALEPSDDLRYMIFGIEEGEEGTPHLQGYAEFYSAKRLRSVKQVNGLTRAHLEPAKGNQEQNIAYCSKDGRSFEIGTRFEWAFLITRLESDAREAMRSCRRERCDRCGRYLR